MHLFSASVSTSVRWDPTVDGHLEGEMTLASRLGPIPGIGRSNGWIQEEGVRQTVVYWPVASFTYNPIKPARQLLWAG